MKKNFIAKKKVVESMADDAIRSLLNEEIDLGPYDSQSEISSRVSQDTPEQTEIRKQIRRLRNMIDDCETDEEVESIRQKIATLKKKAGFDKVYESFDNDDDVRGRIEDYYHGWIDKEGNPTRLSETTNATDDLSKEFANWALNVADTGHDYPVNAVQAMVEWYNGDESALDYAVSRFSEYMGIEDDESVLAAAQKAANEYCYYNDVQGDDDVLSEAFKSKKMKDFSRKHGGLKNGKWSADFKNDIYNMSDEDFDDYVVVDPEHHYQQYGVNGLDKTGYSNNNFQPLTFGDGTFMVKKHPEFRWDDRARKMMDKQIARRNSRRNDGKYEYQFENPYLNDKFNQDYHISKPRGSWGYGTDWKLEPSNINMTALRNMNGRETQYGDVAAKAKASRKHGVSESKLNNIIQKSVKKVINEANKRRQEEKCIGGICFRFAYHDANGNPIWCTDDAGFGKANYWRRHKDGLWYGQSYSLHSDVENYKNKASLNEGVYGYPDGIDNIIFLSENDRELYEEYRQIAKACLKLYKKDVQLTLERLMESSIMKRYQQHCFKKYAKEQQGLDRMNSPREFRRFIAEKIIDEVVNGDWDDREMMNEYYTDDPNDGYDYETGKPYYPGVYGYYSVKPEGVADEIDYAQNARNHQTGWTKRELDNRDKMMNAYVQGERSEDDIDDAWYGIHAFESKIHEEIEQPKQYGYQNVPDEFVEKVGENGYDVLVPDWCLPYLVNGNTDIYEEDEIAAMDAFIEQYRGKLAHGLLVSDACMPMDGEEPSFYSHNDVTGNEGCDCYRVFLPAKESEPMYENKRKNNNRK